MHHLLAAHRVKMVSMNVYLHVVLPTPPFPPENELHFTNINMHILLCYCEFWRKQNQIRRLTYEHPFQRCLFDHIPQTRLHDFNFVLHFLCASIFNVRKKEFNFKI